MKHLKEFYSTDFTDKITVEVIKKSIINDLKKYEYGDDLSKVEDDINKLSNMIFNHFKSIIEDIGDEYENDIENIALKLGE